MGIRRSSRGVGGNRGVKGGAKVAKRGFNLGFSRGFNGGVNGGTNLRTSESFNQGINYRRIRLVLTLLAIPMALLVGRMAYLQLYDNQRLLSLAGQKQTQLISGEDIPRGNIFDRNGMSLTASGLEPALIVFPSMLAQKDATDEAATSLAEILGASPRAIRGMLTTGKSHVYFSGITEAQAKKAKEAQIYGVYSTYIKARYGSGSLARHVVGHTNSIDADAWAVLNQQASNSGTENPYSINDVIGVKGLEAEYEAFLHASDPKFFLTAVRDGRGNIIPGLSFKEVPTASGGTKRNSLFLTLDMGLQKAVEEIMDQHNITNGAVVVQEIASGDILAVASRPNFNQNLIADGVVSSDKAFNNRAFEYFNPGSVFKVLIAAAALEEHRVTPKELFVCNGKHTLDTGLTINCWNREGHGLQDFVSGFANSCNPVFIEVGIRLGREKLLDYGTKFGLAEQKLIGYPMPSFKSLDIESGSQGDVANATLGQKGIRLSPLQVAGMISTVAGGGYYREPRLVKEIQGSQGEILKSFPPGKQTRVISLSVAQEVKNMLGEAVIRGTGRNAWVPGFGAGGKTGSAETGKKGSDGKSILNVWFAGYAPLHNPRFTIVVMKEEGESGGGDAAPVFREIADYALKNCTK